MARSKNGPNKSQAIRDIKAANPKFRTKDIIEALKEQNIKVSANLVYLVLNKDRRRKKRKAREERIGETSRRNNIGDPVKVLIKVKELAAEVGGIRNLKAFVDALFA